MQCDAVGGSGTRPTPIILNASPAVVQIKSSSTPVVMQSSSGGQSPSVGGANPATGGVVILSAGSASSPPPQPVAAAAVTPAGVTIRSATGAPQPQQAYNGPAVGQPSVVQPQPVAITPSPASPAGGVSPPPTIRVGTGSTAASPQTYGPPPAATWSPPAAVPPARPVATVDQPATSARSSGAAAAVPGKPRLTSGELMSKADPLWVCGFILAVVGVAFATMAFEDEVSMTWLLLIVSAASVGVFVKLQL